MSKRKTPLIDKADPFGLFPRQGGQSRSAAAMRKQMLENMYSRRIVEAALNRFEYLNFPDTIDVRYMEMSVFRHGLAVFYFDEQFSRYLALRGTPAGVINMYGNPTQFQVYGNNQVNKRLSSKNCVPIWGNYMRTPDWDFISVFTTQLAEITRTIEIQTMHHRMPFLFGVDDNEKKTFQDVWTLVQQGEPAIFGTETFTGSVQDKVAVFPTGADRGETLGNLVNLKHHVWNEAMTFLGIENSNQDKKERLVVDEVASNNGQIINAREIALNSRRMACEQINKRFDLEVDVIWREGDSTGLQMEADSTLDQEEEDNDNA